MYDFQIFPKEMYTFIHDLLFTGALLPVSDLSSSILGRVMGRYPTFFLFNMFPETRFSLFRKPFQGHTVSI